METPEYWPKIKEILGAALERAPGERGPFLDQACERQPELKAEVESLLAARAEADALFSSEHSESSTTPRVAEGPRTIGPYQLIRELGAGGMGQVWLAEQTEPVQRRIALKLIKAGSRTLRPSKDFERSGNRWPSWNIRRSPRSLRQARRLKASHILQWSMSMVFPSLTTAIRRD